MSTFEEGFRTPAGPSRNRPHGNLAMLRLAVLIIFALLTVKLVDMQIINGAEFARRSDENHIIRTNILPTRGLIVDRNGEALVQNVGVYSASILPEVLPLDEEQRYAIYLRLEDLIGVSALEIQTLVEEAEAEGIGYIAITLRTNLTTDQALALDEASVNMPGVGLVVTPGRYYSAGGEFSHILGYIGAQSPEEAIRLLPEGYQLNEPVGKDGIEARYESDLRGQAGYNAAEQDSSGRLITELATQDPVPGNTLELAIDAELQRYIAELLADNMRDSGTTWGPASVAAAVVMNPKTGEIYALVSLPTYDNNIFAEADIRQAELLALHNDDATFTLLNKPLSVAAPGSTFKIVTAAAGLEEGNISEFTSFYVGRNLEIIGETGESFIYPDWRTHNDTFDVRKALAWSSNVFFFITAGGDFKTIGGLGQDIETSGTVLASWARRFGYGQPTGIDLYGEASGLIPDPAWKRRHYVGEPWGPGDNEWFLGDTYNSAIGQGNVLATPLQVTRMTAAIVNGGKLVTPHVVNRVIGPDGNIVRTIETRTQDVGVSEQTLQIIKEGMLGSVQYGAGARASVASTTVGGKTGTAEFFKPSGVKSQHAWFTGFAPYNDPEIVVTVYFDVGVGGDKAAPVAAKIIDYYMKNVAR
jgi:penicillin-binding protein 2